MLGKVAKFVFDITVGIGALACVFQWLEIKPKDFAMLTLPQGAWLVAAGVLFAISTGSSVYSIWIQGHKHEKELETKRLSLFQELQAKYPMAQPQELETWRKKAEEWQKKWEDERGGSSARDHIIEQMQRERDAQLDKNRELIAELTARDPLITPISYGRVDDDRMRDNSALTFANDGNSTALDVSVSPVIFGKWTVSVDTILRIDAGRRASEMPFARHSEAGATLHIQDAIRDYQGGNGTIGKPIALRSSIEIPATDGLNLFARFLWMECRRTVLPSDLSRGRALWKRGRFDDFFQHLFKCPIFRRLSALELFRWLLDLVFWRFLGMPCHLHHPFTRA